MGSDDKGKGITETIAGEVKAVAVEVYKDVAKAAVSRVGKTLELVVEVTLAVPNMLLGGAKVGLDNLAASLKRKLEGVPEDRLLRQPRSPRRPRFSTCYSATATTRPSFGRCSRTCWLLRWTAKPRPTPTQRSSR